MGSVTASTATARSAEAARRAVIFFIFLFAYMYFFHTGPSTRMSLIQSAVDEHVLHVDRYHTLLVDKAYYGGHYYSDKAVGASLLGLPGYLIEKRVPDDAIETWANAGQVFATWTASSIPSAALVLLFFIFLGRIVEDQTWRFLVTLGYGMGTLAHPYAQLLYGHQLAAALCFGIFYLAVTVKERGATVGRLVAMGLAAGYALITEYSTALILLACCAYLLAVADRRRRLWIPVAAALPVISLQLLYNWKCFGHPLALGYQHESIETFAVGMKQGLLGVTYPGMRVLLSRLWGLTFGHYRGLLVLSPFLLLALPGFARWYRRREWRREFWVAIGIVVGFLLFNASYYMWWGGAGMGPRHLIPALPFAALAVAFCGPRWKALGGVLVAASVVLIAIPTIGQEPHAVEYLDLSSILGESLSRWQSLPFESSLGLALGQGQDVAMAIYLAVWTAAIVGYFRIGRARRPSPVTGGR
jgi:hypothetical protein